MAKTYGIKEVADVTFYDLVTGKPLLYIDTLKVSTIENTAESSSARGGKGNPKILEWDFNRESTITMQDALMSPNSIALITGNKVITGVKTVHKREVLVAVSGGSSETTVELEETPIAGSVYVKLQADEDEEIVVTAGDIVGKEISFDDSEVADGVSVVVYYKFASDASAQTITVSADSFPAYIKVVGDTVIRDSATGVDEPFQFVIEKAKIQPQFTLTFQADGDPTVFDMNLEVFRTDDSPNMIELIKY